ncbi:MAG: hypothetical protein NTY09_14985 [bacterium]|nr:hypothetical protein [bacterium]
MQFTKSIQKLTDISHLATIVLSWGDAYTIKAEYDSKVVPLSMSVSGKSAGTNTTRTCGNM